MGTRHLAEHLCPPRCSAVLVRHRAQCVEECRIPEQETVALVVGSLILQCQCVKLKQLQATAYCGNVCVASDAIGPTQIPRSGGASVGVLGCRVFSMLSA